MPMPVVFSDDTATLSGKRDRRKTSRPTAATCKGIRVSAGREKAGTLSSLRPSCQPVAWGHLWLPQILFEFVCSCIKHRAEPKECSLAVAAIKPGGSGHGADCAHLYNAARGEESTLKS
jgi:hypothetical protein